VFNDLDQTLAALLRRELRENFAQALQISFAAPDDRFPPQSVTLPAINLFLYDLRENLELRDGTPWLERRPDGSAVQGPPPVRVDVSYLVTAWSSPDAVDPAGEEHRLLGGVMRALLRHHVLPDDVLTGELVGQRLPLATRTLQPGLIQAMGEFWRALGIRPKPSLAYTVTLAIDVGTPERVPLVTDKVFKMGLAAGGAS